MQILWHSCSTDFNIFIAWSRFLDKEQQLKQCTLLYLGPPWPWSYGSWIYNYLCKQCLSPQTLAVWIPFRLGVLDTTLCDKVCQWLVAGQWFSSVSSTNKTDHHNITEILLKVVLNTIHHLTLLLTEIFLHVNLHPNPFWSKLIIIL